MTVYLRDIESNDALTFCISNGSRCGKYQGLYPAQTA